MAKSTLTLDDPVTGCKEQVVDKDMDIMVALANAHTDSHTADTDRHQGSVVSIQIVRRKVTQGRSVDLRKSTQVLWRLYGTNTDLSEARRSLRSTQCRNEGLSTQILHMNPNVVDKLDFEQLRLLGRLTVVPADTRNRLWEDGELAQSPSAEGGSEAATYKPGRGRAKKCSRQIKELLNPADHTRDSMTNMDNVESAGNMATPREMVGWSMLEERLSEDTITSTENKKLARKGHVGKTTVVKTGHREQQSASPAGEAKLQASKFGRDVVQASQNRKGSRQRHQQKLDRGSVLQRCDTRKLTAGLAGPDTEREEGEPAPSTSNARSSPCQCPRGSEAQKRLKNDRIVQEKLTQ